MKDKLKVELHILTVMQSDNFPELAVSVIIPVFGVENYIRKCTESLMNQTLENVEFIFVDDCTLDRSMDIVKEITARYAHRNIKILRHDVNKGLPMARNTGMASAQGEYILHVDSDDFVEPTMLEDMYLEANKTNADIVWTDFYLTYGKKERYLAQPAYFSSKDALYGILRGEMKYNVWNKLVRRNLYLKYDIKFPVGLGMGEDMTMIKLFCNASIISYIPKAYYHYVKINSLAFSQTYSERHLNELLQNVYDLSNYLKKYLGKDYRELVSQFQLEVKFPFLISDKKEKYLLWSSWFKDANEYVWKNPAITFRRKMLQGMASLNQWWYVRLYYRILHKILLSALFNK